MRPTKITVKGLFGHFDHDIQTNLEERITIVIGPNGLGKSIMLQMLADLFSGKYSRLLEVPFEAFRVSFHEGTTVFLEASDEVPKRRKTRQTTTTETQRVLIAGRESPTGARAEFQLSQPYELGMVRASLVDESIPNLRRVGPREWMDALTGQSLSLDDVLMQYGAQIPGVESALPEWWDELRQQVNVVLIEAQRLLHIKTPDEEYSYRRKAPRPAARVEYYAKQLASRIESTLAESNALSQSLDRTFPSRLVEELGRSSMPVSQIREKLRDLEQKRAQLKQVGLLEQDVDPNLLPIEDIPAGAESVLSVYVRDVDNKLSYFDDLYRRLALMKSIVDKRYLYKSLVLSRKEGLGLHDDHGSPLPLSVLSSGEQHLLVLLYDLLFNVEEDSLVLIDEPELSLHVAWQQQFLRDLENITKLSSFDAIIATHSPQIIHDRWDLTVNLGDVHAQ